MMDLARLRRYMLLPVLFAAALTAQMAWAGSDEVARAEADAIAPTKAEAVAPGTCLEADGRTELLVRVDGIRNAVGNLRVNVYDDNPENFLVKGKKLYRLDIPARPGTMEVCVPLPGEGTYALVAFHDQNGNGKVNITKDGFGFSNNPKVRWRRPKHAEAAFVAGPGRTEVDVHLRYLFRDKSKRRARAGD